MAKDKKKSNYFNNRAMRGRNLKSGFEYQMSAVQYEFLLSKDGGKMESKEEIIEYLNSTGCFMKPIISLAIL